MDVLDHLPGLHVVSVAAVGEVVGHFQVVHPLLVDLHLDCEPVGLEYFAYVLLQLLGLLALQLRHCQHVVSVEALVHLQVLQLGEEVQADQVRCLGPVKAALSNIKVYLTSFDPGAAFMPEEGVFGVSEELPVVLTDRTPPGRPVDIYIYILTVYFKESRK